MKFDALLNTNFAASIFIIHLEMMRIHHQSLISLVPGIFQLFPSISPSTSNYWFLDAAHSIVVNAHTRFVRLTPCSYEALLVHMSIHSSDFEISFDSNGAAAWLLHNSIRAQGHVSMRPKSVQQRNITSVWPSDSSCLPILTLRTHS